MAGKLNTDRKAVLRKRDGKRLFYICPKCKEVLYIETKYKKNLCMKCGQYLDWEAIEKQWWSEYIVCDNQDEARYCTEIYKKYTGFDWIEPQIFGDKTMDINRRWPKELMFSFLEKIGYGRFMRQIAKVGFERRSIK